MKRFSILVIFLAIVSLLGCSKGNEVSGRSMRSAYRSVSRIKDRLPTEERIEFELSFWALRDDIKNKDDFLDEVGGKTHLEVIEMGKSLYQKRKTTGYKEYEKFNSWDQMITHYSQQRLDQNKRKRPDDRDAENSVIYDL